MASIISPMIIALLSGAPFSPYIKEEKKGGGGVGGQERVRRRKRRRWRGGREGG